MGAEESVGETVVSVPCAESSGKEDEAALLTAQSPQGSPAGRAQAVPAQDGQVPGEGPGQSLLKAPRRYVRGLEGARPTPPAGKLAGTWGHSSHHGGPTLLTSSNSNHLPTPCLQTPPHWDLGLHTGVGGDTNIQPITPTHTDRSPGGGAGSAWGQEPSGDSDPLPGV